MNSFASPGGLFSNSIDPFGRRKTLSRTPPGQVSQAEARNRFSFEPVDATPALASTTAQNKMSARRSAVKRNPFHDARDDENNIQGMALFGGSGSASAEDTTGRTFTRGSTNYANNLRQEIDSPSRNLRERKHHIDYSVANTGLPVHVLTRQASLGQAGQVAKSSPLRMMTRQAAQTLAGNTDDREDNDEDNGIEKTRTKSPNHKPSSSSSIFTATATTLTTSDKTSKKTPRKTTLSTTLGSEQSLLLNSSPPAGSSLLSAESPPQVHSFMDSILLSTRKMTSAVASPFSNPFGALESLSPIPFAKKHLENIFTPAKPANAALETIAARTRTAKARKQQKTVFNLSYGPNGVNVQQEEVLSPLSSKALKMRIEKQQARLSRSKKPTKKFTIWDAWDSLHTSIKLYFTLLAYFVIYALEFLWWVFLGSFKILGRLVIRSIRSRKPWVLVGLLVVFIGTGYGVFKWSTTEKKPFDNLPILDTTNSQTLLKSLSERVLALEQVLESSYVARDEYLGLRKGLDSLNTKMEVLSRHDLLNVQTRLTQLEDKIAQQRDMELLKSRVMEWIKMSVPEYLVATVSKGKVVIKPELMNAIKDQLGDVMDQNAIEATIAMYMDRKQIKDQTMFVTRDDLSSLIEKELETSKLSIKDSSQLKPLVDELISSALKTYSTTHQTLKDYASESLGASIVYRLTSPTYEPKSGWVKWGLEKIGMRFVGSKSPSEVLSGSNKRLGECWPTSGSSGQLVIDFGRQIVPTAVTIEHVSKELFTPQTSSALKSAPKEVSVYAILSSKMPSTISSSSSLLIATPRIDINEDNLISTIGVQSDAQRRIRESGGIRGVMIKIDSNWGGDYTCLYRVRIFGSEL